MSGTMIPLFTKRVFDLGLRDSVWVENGGVAPKSGPEGVLGRISEVLVSSGEGRA